MMRTGSVTAAADELVVTQPSISAAVSALSKELGVGLTERVGRTIRPSAAGQAFAPYAADVIGLLEQGRRTALEAADAATRELRIAAVTTAAEHLVPPLMQAFAAGHPDVSLTLDVGNRARVLASVHEHRADVAIGGRPPHGDRLVAVPFAAHEFVLIASPEDPLAKRRSVPVAELGDRWWLLREEGSGTRTLNEQFLASHELRPRLLTLGSNGAIKQAARAGIGVSLQSRVAVELELDAGVLASVRVHEPLPSRRWYALRSAVGPVRPPVSDFMGFIASGAAQHVLDGAADRSRVGLVGNV